MTNERDMKRTNPKYKSRKLRLQQKRMKRITARRTVSDKSKCGKSEIVEHFIGMINAVKLYHWNTRSFSQHRATDELYERLNDHVDKFVEVLLGKKEDRIKRLSANIPLVNKHETQNFKNKIYQYREYLISMNYCLDSTRDSDLLNIRDEILADLNQFLYLLTFNK